MKRVLLPKLPTPEHSVEIPKNEAKHLIQVLRVEEGELLEAIDGQGGGVLACFKNRHLHYSAELGRTHSGHVLPITLAVSILKNNAMSLVIEKAVELGVRSIVPLMTEFSVVKIKQGEEKFISRWNKTAAQALKQCGRLEALKVMPPQKIEDFLTTAKMSLLFWCDETSVLGATNAKSLLDFRDLLPSFLEYGLLIGPEGGFSPKERELLRKYTIVRSIHLGPLVLRAETAVIYSCSVLSALLHSHITDKNERGAMQNQKKL